MCCMWTLQTCYHQPAHVTLASHTHPPHNSLPSMQSFYVTRKQIANIADWIQAFIVYVAAMSTKYPEGTLDLLAYGVTVIINTMISTGMPMIHSLMLCHVNRAAMTQWSSNERKVNSDVVTPYHVQAWSSKMLVLGWYHVNSILQDVCLRSYHSCADTCTSL